MEKHELITALVESFKGEELEFEAIIDAAKQFVTETEAEIESLKKISGELNGFSMGGPVSVSQETLKTLEYHKFLVDNEAELKKEWDK